MIMICLSTITVNAEEQNDLMQETQSLLDEIDISRFQQEIQEVDWNCIIQAVIRGELDLLPDELFATLIQSAKKELTSCLPQLLRIVGCGVICTGLLQLRGDSGQELSNISRIVSCLCIAVTMVQSMKELFELTQSTIGRMTDFAQAFLPSMLTLLTACGGTHSAAGMHRMTLAVTGSLCGTVQKYLMALLRACALLQLLDAVSVNVRLTRFANVLRSIIHWSLGAGFTILLGCVAVQGGTAAHYDSVVLRAAKFAVDKSIPVVGGAFKDSSDTLISCALIVKSAVGSAGLATIASMGMTPMLRIVTGMLGYRACAAVLDGFGETHACRMLNGFADILLTLFLILLSASALCFMLVSALMHIGTGFV